MHLKIILFLFLFFCLDDVALAQETPAKADSSRLYRDIETFSKKRKSTNFIHHIFFKPVAPQTINKAKIKKKKNLQKLYRAFEGKIIRDINITTLDPFGNTATDTIVIRQNALYKAGNKLHIKSQHITIRNLLLIHKNDPFDSLLVKESERLIRTQKYVNEVFFYVVSAGSDSVDIFIRELDKWSIIPKGSISASRYTVDLTDQNFLGFGHEFQNIFTRNYSAGNYSFNTNYSIPSIRNTYISTALHYGIDANRNISSSLAVDRPFFSPFAKWAAGFLVSQQFQNNSVRDSDSVYIPQNIKYNVWDYWAGNARQVFKGHTEDKRTTNLILTARFLTIRYLEKPIEIYDSLHIYSNEDFYIAGVGISRRKYVQDKYVFRYGVIEDVPVGFVYGLTGGYQVRNNIGRLYASGRISFGNYSEWGYLSCDFEYGAFFRASSVEQGVFTAGVNYFTDLFEIGNWKFRQFVKPQFTLGINRFPYENITINNENGIRGFNTSVLTGTKKMVFTLQTQSYSPWNVFGFRFGPYLIYSLGILGNDATGFKSSRMYSQFGLGVLIKNEYLVFSTFQISIAFYPAIPGDGNNIFKTNANSTTDFGFRDFIIGKPAPVSYQ